MALGALLGCQAPPEEPPAAPLPPDLSFEVINPMRPSALRCAPEVRLGRKVSRDVLETVANEIRRRETAECSFSFVAFYLPHMEPGSGAWAIAEFHPEAVVTVLGLSLGEEEQLLEAARELPGLLGAWVDDTSYASVITLRRAPAALVMDRLYPEGRVESEKVRIAAPGGAVRVSSEDSDILGRYYSVTSRGDLETRDDHGVVNVSPKLRLVADLQRVAAEERARRVERAASRRVTVARDQQAQEEERWGRFRDWLAQYRSALEPVRHQVMRLASLQDARTRRQSCAALTAALEAVPPGVRQSPEPRIDIADLEEILSRMNAACSDGRHIQVMVDASSAIAIWRKLDRDLRELVGQLRKS